MCPEQYNVYLDGEEIAYLRLRHGHFTAEMPIGGVLVYAAHPKGDGCFEDDERDWYIQNAIHSIEFALRQTNYKSNLKAYKIAKTSWMGTYVAGIYEAESEEEALSLAKLEHGEWTYYVISIEDE